MRSDHRSPEPARGPSPARRALPRRRVPLAAAALGALAALAALLAAGDAPPAGAQATPVTLVSNTGQSNSQSGELHVGASTRSQAFTTGSNSGGYTLSSIGLVVSRTVPEAARDALRVEVWTAGTGDSLNTKVASLTVPAHPINAATVSFTAPANTTLTASTKYYVVAYTTTTITDGSLAPNFRATDSFAEDSGAAAGWSIGNGMRAATSNAPSSSTTGWDSVGLYGNTASLKIAVKGTAKSATTPTTTTVPTSDPLDLSALVVAGSTDNNTFAALSGAAAAAPAFDADTTSYRATVGSAVTHVKVTPTAAGASTLRAGKSGSLAAVASGSASASIALDVGDNEIAVRVTDADSNTRDYTVTVHRAPAGAVWFATLVADASGDYFGCDNADAGQGDCSTAGVLTEDEITHSGTTYTVEYAFWHSAEDALAVGVADDGTALTAAQHKAAFSSLNLHADGATFAVSAADDATDGISWSHNPAADWADGRLVSLSLAPAPPDPLDLTALVVTGNMDGGSQYNALTGAAAMAPAFDAGTTAYRATVGNNVDSLQLSATAAVSGSTVKFGKSGATLTAGTALGDDFFSAAISLAVGDNEITVQVADADSNTRDYTVTVRRAPSGTVWFATLVPVANEVGGLDGVGCNGAGECASQLTDSDFVSGGSTYDFSTVNHFNNKFFQVTTAPTTGLETLRTANKFCVGATGHTIRSSGHLIGKNVDAAVFTAGAPVSLSIGSACAQAATSSDADLSGLSVATATESGGTFSALTLTPASFDAATLAYTASVANSVTHAKVTATVADTGKATVAVEGAAATSGEASAEIMLAEGANEIDVVVTAEDGTTTKEYTVTITRAAATPSITLSTASASVAEDAGAVTIGVSLSRAPTSSLTVSFARGSASTATATSDYTGLAAATVASGATTGSTTVTIVDDTDVEGPETLVIEASAAGYTSGSLTLTITDNDTPPTPTITLTSSDSDGRLPEGDADSTVTITATLSANAPTGGVTVALARDASSTATATTDYTLAATTIPIGAGDDSGTVVLTVKGDQVDEDNETIILNATASGHTAGSLTQTIVDDDDAGVTVSQSTRGVKVGETTSYTVKLDSQPTGNVVIRARSADTDKATVSPARRTFTTANWDTPQTFTVSGVALGTVDVTHDVTTADTAGGYPTTLSIGSVAVTVSALPTITLTSSDSDGRLPEGDADSTVTITATLSADAPTGGVVVNLARDAASTATATTDYTLSAAAVSIAGGASSGTVTLTVKGDQVDEDNETIVLNATASGHTAGSLTQTIVDDDDAGVTVSQNTRGVKVGETTSYTVKLDSQPTGNVVVRARSADTDKATVSPARRTFTTANWNTPQTFTVTGVAVGTVDVTHDVTTADTAGGYPTTLSIGSVAVTVSALPTITLTSSDSDGRLPEGDADSTVTITATLSADAPTGGVTVAVARDGASTATATTDYTLSAASISIAGGASSGTVVLTVKGDQVDEDNETIVLNATASGHTAGSLTQTIVDDDTAGVTVSESTRTTEAGETTSYTVKLNSQPTGNVVVRARSSATDKATVSPATRTFTSSNWNTAQSFTVRGTAAGTATVTHAVTTADTAGKYPTSLSISQVAVTVTPSTKTYEITSTLEVDEDVSGGNAALTVTLGRAAGTGGHALTVSYANRGTTSNADRGTVETSLTVTQGATTATLNVPIADDDLVEGDEAFTVTISSSTSGWNPKRTGANTATVTIDDDDADAAKIAFGSDAAATAAHTATVSELAAGALVSNAAQTSLNGELAEAVAQGFTTGSAAGGYVLASVRLSVPSGTGVSNTEDLRAELWSEADAGGPGTRVAGLRVPSGIAAGASFELAAPGTALSADTTYYVVLYDGAASESVSLQIGYTASDSEDSGAAAGWSIEDTHWSSSVRSPQGTWSEESYYSNSMRITVDAAPAGAVSALEVPVTVSHLPQAATTFDVEVVATGARRAARDTDYSVPASVRFGPSDTSMTKDVTVTVRDDQFVEFDETVSLRIAAADATPDDLGDHYSRHASGSTAEVTIADDEAAAAAVAFGRAGDSAAAHTRNVGEFEDPVVDVTVTALPSAPTTFVITVTGGTATEGAAGDYTIAEKAVTFGPATARTQQFAIDVNDDSLVEDDQTITLAVAAAADPAAAVGDLYLRHRAGAAAELTIRDDEAPDAKAAFGSSALNTAKILRSPGEGAGTVTVPITVTAAPEQSTQFTLSVAGTATKGADYTIAAETFTFTKTSALTQNVSIALTDDAWVEDDQTIELEIASGSGFFDKYARHEMGRLATVTIDDDEADTAAVAFGTDPASTSRHTASVAETVAGGTLDVPVTVNHLPETDTTFTIEVVAAGTTALDADDADNPAGNPRDYTIATKSVTFGPATAKTRNLTVAVADDDVEEDDETIALRVAAADDPVDDLGDHYMRHASAATSQVTIQSEDAVSEVALTIDGLAKAPTGEYRVAEGNELTLRAAADIAVGPGGWRVAVSRHALDGFRRYMATVGAACGGASGQFGGFACPNDVTLPAAFTIPEGQREATAKLTIAADTRTENTPERLDLTADATRKGRSLNTGRLQLRIAENTKGVDLTPSALELVPEETATYTVALRGAAPAADVTVTISSSDADKATATNTLTFTSTNHADPQTVTVTAVAEGTTTISHQATSSDSTWNLGASSLGTVTVTVNAASQTYAIEPATTAAEGDDAQLVLTLGAVAPTGGLEFSVDRSRSHRDRVVRSGRTFWLNDPATATVADDLASPPAAVTVTAGERTATITDPTAEDDLVEGAERYYLTVTTTASGWTAATAGANCVTADAGCARVTITDPDADTATVAFGDDAAATTAHTATIAENGGTLSVPVTVSALPATATTFDIEVLTTASGRATEGADYTIATKSVTFGPSDTTTTKNLTVTITDDTTSEGDETITLRVAAADDPATGLEDLYQRHASGSQATITITDNDGSVTVSDTGLTVRPGATAAYTLRLGARPTRDVTVTPTSNDTDVATVSCPGADPCALTFTPANWSQTQTVTVTGVAEGTTAIGHAVAGGDPAYPTTLQVASVDVTVAAGATATLTVSPNPVREGGTVTVTITLTEALGAAAAAPITLGASGDTAEPGDHGTLANIPIRAAGTTFRAAIRTNHDTDTKDETFTVALGDLTAITGLSAGSPSSQLVTITDDDPPRALRLTIRPRNQSLALSWTLPTGDITGYSVAYKTADAPDTDATTAGDPATGWTDWPHTGAGRTATITGLQNGTPYTVRVTPQGTPDITGDAATTTATATPTDRPPTTGGGFAGTGAGAGGGAGGGGAPDGDQTQQTPQFADVDTENVHADGIAALHRARITTGCSTRPLKYCPNQPVTRAQMATFLTRALKLETPQNPPGFADTEPGGAHTEDIAAIHAAGITTGCRTHGNQTSYCPDQPVTRAQMATLLARALKLKTPDNPPGFTDVHPDSVHAPHIAALHAARITTGCTTQPLRYCPNQPVTRAEMATLLTRALKLE